MADLADASDTTRRGGADCIAQVGACLVVFDDSSRAQWERIVPGRFHLRGIRPDADDRARIADHLGRDGRLLVVLGYDREPVFALPEEISELRAAAFGGPEVVELRIDPLDWLDAGMRRRGDEFVRNERARYGAAPPLARAAITLSEEVDGVSFLLRGPSTSARHVRQELATIVVWASRLADAPPHTIEPPRQIGALRAL